MTTISRTTPSSRSRTVFSALIDANVLFSLYIRDLILELGISGIFQPLWSPAILEDTHRALNRKGPRFGASFTKQVDIMNTVFPESLVTDYEHLLGTIGGVHPSDEHVLAAAIRRQAGALVTFNLRHFPNDMFDSFGIELRHPDDFLLEQSDLAPHKVLAGLARQLVDYDRPHLAGIELAQIFAKNRCPQFSQYLADHVEKIDALVMAMTNQRRSAP